MRIVKVVNLLRKGRNWILFPLTHHQKKLKSVAPTSKVSGACQKTKPYIQRQGSPCNESPYLERDPSGNRASQRKKRQEITPIIRVTEGLAHRDLAQREAKEAQVRFSIRKNLGQTHPYRLKLEGSKAK